MELYFKKGWMDLEKRIVENTPTIETERLLLRKFTTQDSESLFELLKDGEVNTFLPWFPLKNRTEATVFLQERFLSFYDAPCGYRYAICLQKDQKPIGYVWLSNDTSNDFGYALGKTFWHQGIVTEASKAVVERIQNAGYPYITATHDVHNPRSGDVMKRLGMVYQYSYVERWLPKDIAVTFRMYQRNFHENDDSTYLEYWNKYEQHFIENIEF